MKKTPKLLSLTSNTVRMLTTAELDATRGGGGATRIVAGCATEGVFSGCSCAPSPTTKA